MLAALAVVLTALLCGHRLVPDIAGIGAMLDSFLPWLGLGVPVLILFAIILRAYRGLLTAAVPTTVWLVMFVPTLCPHGYLTGGNLTVVTQNIEAANPDQCGALNQLAATGADLIAVQELGNCEHNPLDARYPNHTTKSTVGLWSRYPIAATTPLALGLGWYRALRADIATPYGTLVVYVAHLASIRPGIAAQRDLGLSDLAEDADHDNAARVLIVGDLNTASTDRRMSEFTGFREAQQSAGCGFGFTWPASVPLTRPDHMLYRGVTAVRASTLPANGSDHRAVTSTFRL